jgi:exodeoxyribonuclease V beta subunit
MASHFYFLQYLIYTVALEKFLKSRLNEKYSYEKNFGGIFYIFLRGVDDNPESHRGIFHDRPDEAVINDLSKLLCERSI